MRLRLQQATRSQHVLISFEAWGSTSQDRLTLRQQPFRNSLTTEFLTGVGCQDHTKDIDFFRGLSPHQNRNHHDSHYYYTRSWTRGWILGGLPPTATGYKIPCTQGPFILSAACCIRPSWHLAQFGHRAWRSTMTLKPGQDMIRFLPVYRWLPKPAFFWQALIIRTYMALMCVCMYACMHVCIYIYINSR